MNILLIYPEFPDTFWSFKHALEFVGKRAALRGNFKFSLVLALFRSFYRLGIVGRERFHFWALLLWTQFRRPRLIPEAVTLAIYGYHFRKICERHVV